VLREVDRLEEVRSPVVHHHPASYARVPPL
jgi:hypothetical protein